MRSGARRALFLLALAASGAGAAELKTPLGAWTVSGYGEGYLVLRTDRDTPQQHPTGIVDLNVGGALHRSVKFYLDTRLIAGGTPVDPDGFGIYDLSHTFQNVDPGLDFEEGYLDLSLGPVDARVGKQKFAWGKLDTFHPTDVLNPRKFTDPFVMDELDAKVGIPAVQATYPLPRLGARLPRDLAVTLVWIPVPFPTRFPLTRERWFPPAINLEEAIVLPALAVAPANPIVIHNTLGTENRRPPQQLDEGAVGLRLAGVYGPVDGSLYYYDGVETAPAFDFTTSVFWPAVRRALRHGVPPAFPPAGEPIRLSDDATLLPRFGRIRLAGADMATEISGLTLRAEAAYGADRLLPRSVRQLISAENVLGAVGGPARQAKLAAQLLAGRSVRLALGDLFVVSDTVEWGIGADYVYKGWTPVAQVNQTVVLGDVPKLLVADVDTRFLMALRRSFLGERLATEVEVIQGLPRSYTLAVARVTYAVTDHLRVRAGYLFNAGSRETVIGQFHDNDEGFLQARVAF